MAARMKGSLIGLVMTLGVSASCAHPAGDKAPAQVGNTHVAATGHDTDDEEEVTCDFVKVTGSNIRQRVCRTRRQVFIDNEAAERGMREAQQRGAVQNIPSH